MRIALDSWVLSNRFRNHGIQVYTQHLFRAFRRIAATEEIELTLFANPEYSDAELGAARHFAIKNSGLVHRERLWRIAGASLAARGDGADLLFSPSATVLPTGLVPVVCTIHDVTPVVMPSHSAKINAVQKLFLWASARLSRAVITDSECSKKDIVKIYGVPEEKVSVVYLGFNKAVFNDVEPDREAQKVLLQSCGIDRPYILHHGTIQPRKNLKRLIEAYRLMLTRNPSIEVDLVLAGGLGWHYEEIMATAKEPGRGRVLLPGPLSDPELALLVKGATLAVIPSLYEGFCLPMVECMACGTPTIAANASCLPEVSGGTLRYFDPLSVEEMSVRMEEVLKDAGLRQELAAKGKQQATRFEWEACAQKTLAILKQQAR